MELAEILSEESVMFCTDATSKRDVLFQLSERAAAVTGQDVNVIFEAIDSREALGSTGLGNAIAIPHGKIAGIDRVTAIFACCRTPVDFDSVDDVPVDLIMMLLAPMGAGADHLKALALVARVLRTEAATDRLRKARTTGDIHNLLTQKITTHAAA